MFYKDTGTHINAVLSNTLKYFALFCFDSTVDVFPKCLIHYCISNMTDTYQDQLTQFRMLCTGFKYEEVCIKD